jgi:hypothetical protein
VVRFNDYHYSLPGEHKYLAEIFFRLDVNEVVHYRKVYGFGDWLATVAGIERLLLKWVTFVLGGWIQYNAVIEIVN